MKLTKERRTSIAKAEKLVEIIGAMKNKLDKRKEDNPKVDLASIAEKVGKEMREKMEKNTVSKTKNE
jgi:hypothetical protein